MKLRSALAATVVLALGGTLAPGHAEDWVAKPVAAPAEQSLPRFEPSKDAALVEVARTAQDVAAPARFVSGEIVQPIPEQTDDAFEDLGNGVASYYGKRFAGRRTASGETFDPGQFTAAHRTLPFGSKVRVTNPRNGKSVVVRINDRGPFVKGRTIDVSRSAADELGIVSRGHGTVELALLVE